MQRSLALQDCSGPERMGGRVSPAAVDDADQLLFITVVPHRQLHLAQRPNRSLRGAVERRRRWRLGKP